MMYRATYFDLFRTRLNQKYNNKNTADRYYYAVKRFFKGIAFENFYYLTKDDFINRLKEIKTKNEFSAIKNGLVVLNEMDPNIEIPYNFDFLDISKNIKNRTLNPAREIDYTTYFRKINGLRQKDFKYKLVFRLMLISGLRVSEAAKLTKDSVSISKDGTIAIQALRKGGNTEQIICMTDNYVTEKLSEHIKNASTNDILFYSASTIKKKAWKMGIQTHDLRRIAARKFRKQQIKEYNKTNYEANGNTQKFLGHTNFGNSKRYLFNKKITIVKV